MTDLLLKTIFKMTDIFATIQKKGEYGYDKNDRTKIQKSDTL